MPRPIKSVKSGAFEKRPQVVSVIKPALLNCRSGAPVVGKVDNAFQ